MQISISVKTGKKEARVIERDGVHEIWTKSRPHDGKANDEILTLLAEYFKVPKGRIKIIQGLKTKHKLVRF